MNDRCVTDKESTVFSDLDELMRQKEQDVLKARMRGCCLSCGFRVGWLRRVLGLHDIDENGICGLCREKLHERLMLEKEKHDRIYDAALIHVETFRETYGHIKGEKQADELAFEIADRITRYRR